MYFEVRTKRLTVTEKNTYKTVKELRLFEAVSYTEAESLSHEYMGKEFPKEDFRIAKISESEIQEVDFLDNECEMPFWKVKLNELHENENGKIKKTPSFILVQADSSSMAVEQADISAGLLPCPTEIVKVELTKICAVIKRPKEETPAKADKPKKNKK